MTWLPETPQEALALALHRDGCENHEGNFCCGLWVSDYEQARRMLDNLDVLGWLPPRPAVNLPSQASTRSGGASTSRCAASSICDLNARQLAVLDAATRCDEPWTLDDLASLYAWDSVYRGWPDQTPQSIRSRAAELKRAGHLEVIGTGTSAHGRPARTWRVTRVGEEVAA